MPGSKPCIPSEQPTNELGKSLTIVAGMVTSHKSWSLTYPCLSFVTQVNFDHHQLTIGSTLTWPTEMLALLALITSSGWGELLTKPGGKLRAESPPRGLAGWAP